MLATTQRRAAALIALAGVLGTLVGAAVARMLGADRPFVAHGLHGRNAHAAAQPFVGPATVVPFAAAAPRNKTDWIRLKLGRGRRKMALADEATWGSANSCPSGYEELTTAEACRAALDYVDVAGDEFMAEEDDSDWPRGCYSYPPHGVWFNHASPGSTYDGAVPICGKASWVAALAATETLFSSATRTWTTGRRRNSPTR